MKKTILTLTLTLLLLFSTKSYAQDYQRAVGIRLGTGIGVTYKQFLKPSAAIEATLDLGNMFTHNNFNIVATATYQFNFDVNVEGLSLYTGPGASIGTYLGDHTGFLLAIAGVAGVEYKFNKTPIALSFDWTPKLRLTQGVGFIGDNFGLGVKYTF